MEVVKLLESKNRCLKRFLRVSADFLPCAELGDFSTLDGFELHRESSIKALELYDAKISETVHSLLPEQKTQALIFEIEARLREKEAIVSQIIELDQKIMRCIDAEKSRVGRELTQSRKSGEMVKKFKSAWVPEAGEELDRKL